MIFTNLTRTRERDTYRVTAQFSSSCLVSDFNLFIHTQKTEMKIHKHSPPFLQQASISTLINMGKFWCCCGLLVFNKISWRANFKVEGRLKVFSMSYTNYLFPSLSSFFSLGKETFCWCLWKIFILGLCVMLTAICICVLIMRLLLIRMMCNQIMVSVWQFWIPWFYLSLSILSDYFYLI